MSPADHKSDVGRLGELLLEAAKFGLCIFLYPPSYVACECPECARRPPAWRTQVIGLDEGEDLASGETIAEAVEFSFLPLQLYIESGLEPGYLPVRAQIEMPDELELGCLAELVAAAREIGVALHINSPSEPSKGWCVGLMAEGPSQSQPLGFGATLAEAVGHAFLPLRRFIREGSA
jgi:hypothetical protein